MLPDRLAANGLQLREVGAPVTIGMEHCVTYNPCSKPTDIRSYCDTFSR